ncbi:hypothetical protein ACFSQD_14445 [Flavihumibacter stibioxidans]|nr:hypothetical protein [Flavihumibacter stibioxidans]
MKKLVKQIFKIVLVTMLLAAAAFGGLLWTGIIWRSPAYYTVASQQEFVVPIMNMQAYDSLGNHPRPYIYQINAGKGSVYVLGIEHTKDIKKSAD